MKKPMILLISIMAFVSSFLAGCVTTPAQPQPTLAQQKALQQARAMQARWRNDELLEYSQVPGGLQAYQQLEQRAY